MNTSTGARSLGAARLSLGVALGVVFLGTAPLAMNVVPIGAEEHGLGPWALRISVPCVVWLGEGCLVLKLLGARVPAIVGPRLKAPAVIAAILVGLAWFGVRLLLDGPVSRSEFQEIHPIGGAATSLTTLAFVHGWLGLGALWHASTVRAAALRSLLAFSVALACADAVAVAVGAIGGEAHWERLLTGLPVTIGYAFAFGTLRLRSGGFVCPTLALLVATACAWVSRAPG